MTKGIGSWPMLTKETAPKPLGQWLDWGCEELKVLGAQEARASAERLLQELLDQGRANLYREAGRFLEPSLQKAYQRLVQGRKARVPLAYLLKKAYFWNEVLEVGPGCLIPRPETEVMVERFIEKAGFKQESSFSFLDLCCGSGAIGIALLRNFPHAHGTFGDISDEALEQTKTNLSKYSLLDRSTILKSNLFDAFEENKAWDAILSNPPYLSSEDWKGVEPEILQEPRLALDGGEDGFDFYHRISKKAPDFLKPQGVLFLEVGVGQAEKVQCLLKEPFKDHATFKDYAGIDRVVVAVR